MRTVVLWRHGRTAWNALNRFQGHSDVELDETGRRQARDAAPALAGLSPTLIVSSDLARAQQTARELAALTGLGIITDRALRETDAGSWEGMTHEEIRSSDGDNFARWAVDADVRPGGTGETRAEVGTRVGEAVARHASAVAAGETVVIVTHGGAARSAVGHLMDWPVMTWRNLHVLDNCGWAVLRMKDTWQLAAYNRRPA